METSIISRCLARVQDASWVPSPDKIHTETREGILVLQSGQGLGLLDRASNKFKVSHDGSYPGFIF